MGRCGEIWGGMERGGEQVPYFLVSKEGLPLDGSTPTLLYG